MKKNPFKPTFGSIPFAMAGRENIIEEIIDGLDNAPGDPNRASIFVGERGTGKTVMMARISEIAEQKGWISAHVTSGRDLLEEIVVQVREKASHILSPETIRRISGLQIAGSAISFSFSEERTTWRSEMTRLVKELNESGTGLLITVDEVSAKDESLKVLIDTFQHFVRERRDVAIMMAGLPSNVSSLLMDERVSFVRRAFRHDLKAIEIPEVAYALRDTVRSSGRDIDDDAMWYAAELTEGFAFMIQLIGYHMWRQNPDNRIINKADVEGAMEFAKKHMESAVFEDMYLELTEREKEFLFAMTFENETPTISISDRLGISPNNVTHIKKRLLERGIIVPAGRGKVSYAQKSFMEYVERVTS